MAALPPTPPILPNDESEFHQHVLSNPTVWFEYCKATYEWISTAATSQNELSEKIARLGLQLSDSREENNGLREQVIRLQSIVNFQREEATSIRKELVALEKEKDTLVATASPTILLRERLRLLLLHLPRLLSSPNAYLTPTSFQAIRKTSGVS